LVRQYAPKGRSMHALTDEEIQIIEDKLNNRPRKTLGFKTPREVVFASFKRRTS
jgi:IS30 family transposase